MSELTTMLTTAEEWRARREPGIELTLLEYGDVIRIRPMDAGFFLMSGKIPDYLQETVRQLIDGTIRQVEVPKVEGLEDTKEWLTWLDELVMWTVVSPKVVKTAPGENEISIDEIGLADKLNIYRFFGQPAHVLRNFRQAQVESVALVDAPKNNGAKTKRSAADQALGQPSAGNA